MGVTAGGGESPPPETPTAVGFHGVVVSRATRNGLAVERFAVHVQGVVFGLFDFVHCVGFSRFHRSLSRTVAPPAKRSPIRSKNLPSGVVSASQMNIVSTAVTSVIAAKTKVRSFMIAPIARFSLFTERPHKRFVTCPQNGEQRSVSVSVRQNWAFSVADFDVGNLADVGRGFAAAAEPD